MVDSNHTPGAAEHELEIARRIQSSFLPESLPQPAGWEMAAWFQAAREVAGDFYDAFPVANGKRVALVIADVCDKGVGAAIFMALFRTLIRAFVDQHHSLGWMDVLGDSPLDAYRGGSVQQRRSRLSAGMTSLKNAVALTNRYVVRNHAESSMFATMFVGIIDPDTGSLIYINAGHEPALIVAPDGVRARLEPTGPAVGIIADADFAVEQCDLRPGEALVAYTDGVTDARNGVARTFGADRLLGALEGATDAAGLVHGLRGALTAFMGAESQFDDITVLALRRAGR